MVWIFYGLEALVLVPLLWLVVGFEEHLSAKGYVRIVILLVFIYSVINDDWIKGQSCDPDGCIPNSFGAMLFAFCLGAGLARWATADKLSSE